MPSIDAAKASFPIRTTRPSERDPLRNFKFRAEFVSNQSVRAPFATMGFISIGGFGVQTDMIPYREGGDNTTTRKMPGQSEFSPLSMVGGIFMDNKNAGYEWFKHVFSVISGKGNTGWDEDFRADLIISVLVHPTTKYSDGGPGDPTSLQSAGMRIKVYNCWPGSVNFNDLNAGDNSIMVSTMQIHHEGWTPLFGGEAAGNNWPL
jgi:phage tail-like protein